MKSEKKTLHRTHTFGNFEWLECDFEWIWKYHHLLHVLPHLNGTSTDLSSPANFTRFTNSSSSSSSFFIQFIYETYILIMQEAKLTTGFTESKPNSVDLRYSSLEFTLLHFLKEFTFSLLQFGIRQTYRLL